MKVFLVVIFMVGGEPFIMDGFHPLEMEGFVECTERSTFLRNHLPTIPSLPESYASCVLAQNDGEAVLEVIRERTM